jgi:hypothetical protein
MHMPGFGDAAVRVVIAENEQKAFDALERIRRKGDEIFDVRWLQPGRISNWPPLVLADQLDDPDMIGIDWVVACDEFGEAKLPTEVAA